MKYICVHSSRIASSFIFKHSVLVFFVKSQYAQLFRRAWVVLRTILGCSFVMFCMFFTCIIIGKSIQGILHNQFAYMPTFCIVALCFASIVVLLHMVMLDNMCKLIGLYSMHRVVINSCVSIFLLSRKGLRHVIKVCMHVSASFPHFMHSIHLEFHLKHHLVYVLGIHFMHHVVNIFLFCLFILYIQCFF